MQEMNKYNFNNGTVSIPQVNILYGVNLEGTYVDFDTAYATPGNIRFVQVTTPQLAIPVSFAAMVLGTSKNMSATATAGLSVPLNSFCNFIPLSVIDYDIPMVPGQTYTIRADTGGSPSPGNYQILAVADRVVSMLDLVLVLASMPAHPWRNLLRRHETRTHGR
jgi:hypothetical protein